MSQSQSSSIVSEEVIKRDPRKLAFLYPKLPLSRFRKLTDEYYMGVCLKAAEDVAKMTGHVLVPSRCMNKKRRDPDRRVMLFGRTYYTLTEKEMTELEAEKYVKVLQ